ncbi:anamorsin homolog 1-like [Triticum urartu]|uniref:anamorsin homolog 1-like n=1 Tax=Triticum urartu TaxID=4572 RepID=UPI002043B18E|nr:anamorsin homolog 1-like [Triticum urartu]
MASTAVAALTVTDELALPLRAVGDLAAAARVSREEVVVITQCTSLGGWRYGGCVRRRPQVLRPSSTRGCCLTITAKMCNVGLTIEVH